VFRFSDRFPEIITSAQYLNERQAWLWTSNLLKLQSSLQIQASSTRGSMNFRKLTITLLLGAYGIYVLVLCWTDISYYSRLPKNPDPNSGKVHRMVVSHGSVRYGSERELRFRERLLGLTPIPHVVFFAALVLGLKWGVLQIGKSR
jgi:hypothetical protein